MKRTRIDSARFCALGVLTVAWLFSRVAATAQPAPVEVTVSDSGVSNRPSWAAKHKGHQMADRTITLDSGARAYAIKYSGCVDASHPATRGYEEGYIGMPRPAVCNWYHSGFFFVTVGGKELGDYPMTDMRVLERGARGSLHLVWELPETSVRVRFLTRANDDCVFADVTWQTKSGADAPAVGIRLVCYPSYFTAANRRQGDRHVTTPRLTRREGETLDLVPAADTYLFYDDGVFDPAKGEGQGPCAALFLADDISGGQVQIGSYAVTTRLTVAASARRVRLAFWDFNGQTNAQAAEQLRETAPAIRQTLTALDFRPASVGTLDLTVCRSDLARVLADAGDDATPYRPKVERLLARMSELKPLGDRGDWRADADLAGYVTEFETLVWKLRIQALLNRADR